MTHGGVVPIKVGVRQGRALVVLALTKSTRQHHLELVHHPELGILARACNLRSRNRRFASILAVGSPCAGLVEEGRRKLQGREGSVLRYDALRPTHIAASSRGVSKVEHDPEEVVLRRHLLVDQQRLDHRLRQAQP